MAQNIVNSCMNTNKIRRIFIKTIKVVNPNQASILTQKKNCGKKSQIIKKIKKGTLGKNYNLHRALKFFFWGTFLMSNIFHLHYAILCSLMLFAIYHTTAAKFLQECPELHFSWKISQWYVPNAFQLSCH